MCVVLGTDPMDPMAWTIHATTIGHAKVIGEEEFAGVVGKSNNRLYEGTCHAMAAEFHASVKPHRPRLRHFDSTWGQQWGKVAWKGRGVSNRLFGEASRLERLAWKILQGRGHGEPGLYDVHHTPPTLWLSFCFATRRRLSRTTIIR